MSTNWRDTLYLQIGSCFKFALLSAVKIKNKFWATHRKQNFIHIVNASLTKFNVNSAERWQISNGSWRHTVSLVLGKIGFEVHLGFNYLLCQLNKFKNVVKLYFHCLFVRLIGHIQRRMSDHYWFATANFKVSTSLFINQHFPLCWI